MRGTTGSANTRSATDTIYGSECRYAYRRANRHPHGDGNCCCNNHARRDADHDRVPYGDGNAYACPSDEL